MLVNGVWSERWDPLQTKRGREGHFVRQESQFRETDIKLVDPVNNLKTRAKNRYCIYAVYICPWASRTLIARSLLGLESSIDVCIGEPEITDKGWYFTENENQGASSHTRFIYELYTQSNTTYSGRATVPVLWDRIESRIINNESSDIVRILNKYALVYENSDINLYPVNLRSDIDKFNHQIYESLNNGVYKAGFAEKESAYSNAIDGIYYCLDKLEDHFKKNEYAVGNILTEADIRLFVTLARFDVAYYGLFKVNRKHLFEYPNLSRYFEMLLENPAFSKNTNVDHIKRGYYSVRKLNPSGIVPDGPDLSWFRYLPDQNVAG